MIFWNFVYEFSNFGAHCSGAQALSAHALAFWGGEKAFSADGKTSSAGGKAFSAGGKTVEHY